jgi:hypothetical protein
MGARPLSSITERLRHQRVPDSERGQVLVIFAGGLVLILLIAALVFDLGQALVDRRTEQNAADAAALAGARYIPTATGSYQGLCTARGGSITGNATYKQVNTACDVATQYLAADGLTATVTVKYPPGPESEFSGLPNNIEVQIDASRPSFFAGVIGIVTRHTGAIGVAANSSGYTLPYSLLSLDPTGCGSSKVTGGGTITVGGTIHVDSNCSSDAFLISGQGAVTAPSCDAVGTIQVSGGGTGCSIQNNGSQVLGDPLRELPVPSTPTSLGQIQIVAGTSNPKGGSGCGNYMDSSGNEKNPAVLTSTVTSPSTCTIQKNNTYRMYPGYYPGGLHINAGTIYMEPGIYVIGGGGLNIQGATLISTASGGTTLGGGVLIVDTTFRLPSFCSGGTTSGCVGNMDWSANGTTVELLPLQASAGTVYTNMLLFVDRQTSPYRPTLTLNGGSTVTSLTGTIYAPTTSVTLNGNGAASVASQLIAYDFVINGNTGNLDITYNSDQLFQLTGVGLVQ